MKVIITASGTGSRLGNITLYTNKSLVKVGDKFTIDYIIDFYKDIEPEFIITLGYKGDLVKQYLEVAYPDLIFKFVWVDKYEGEGSSLGYSLLQAREYLNEPFYFHCCDSIILANFEKNHDHDRLFLADCQDTTLYSSVRITKNIISHIFEKGEINFDYIYIGVAFIKSHQKFWAVLEKLENSKFYGSRLSDIHVYMKMIKEERFQFSVIREYYDIGTVENYRKANRKIGFRYNVVPKITDSISFHSQKVIKFFKDESSVKERLKRVSYIKNTPKILNSGDNFFSMELIDSPPLSEIYKRGMIKKLLIWAEKFLWIEGHGNIFEEAKKFYYSKTYSRTGKFFSDKLGVDYETINGLKIGNIYNVLEKVDWNSLFDGRKTLYHGDFILDNILLKDDQFILIDWRENFGGNIEYGDMYYDLSKLRHNIFFNHRNIEEKLYFLKKIEDEECILDMKTNFFLIEQLEDFENFVKERGLDYKKIKILTAIIWINMAPLYEYPLSEFLFNFGKYNLYLKNE
jgi:NDP-sugar pyrophosphorylase family protein